jgi:hypothetical protein
MALWRSSRTSIDTAHRASLSEACRRWGQMVLQDKLCKRCRDVADLIIKVVCSRWVEGCCHWHDKRWRWGATGAKVYQPLTMRLSRKTNWRAVWRHMKISCIKCKGVPGVVVVAQPEWSWWFQATVAHCNNAWGLPWANSDNQWSEGVPVSLLKVKKPPLCVHMTPKKPSLCHLEHKKSSYMWKWHKKCHKKLLFLWHDVKNDIKKVSINWNSRCVGSMW